MNFLSIGINLLANLVPICSYCNTFRLRKKGGSDVFKFLSLLYSTVDENFFYIQGIEIHFQLTSQIKNISSTEQVLE